MKHYFHVEKVNENRPIKRRSFLSSFLSRLSVTSWIILINVICFIVFLIASMIFGTDFLTNLFALQANNLFIQGYFWTLLTSMFLHANFFHLFINMISLFFLGSFLELLLGKKRYFWLYLFSGLFAGLFFSLLAFYFGNGFLGKSIFGGADVFAVGASGAIFALAGVLAFLTPNNKVQLVAGPLVAIILGEIIPMVAPAGIASFFNVLISIYIFIAIFSMFSPLPFFRKLALFIPMPFWLLPIAAIVPLIIIGFFVQLPIGNMAHLGGFIAGAIYGLYLRLKFKNKTRIISAYFSE
jgi:membrane associated rhomboid family serine protease